MPRPGCRRRRVRHQAGAGCGDDHPRGPGRCPAAWVAGDEVYGADPQLRGTIRDHGLGYVLQVAANRRVPTHAGPMRVDELAATMPGRRVATLLRRAGSKGPRYYSWAWIALLPEDDPEATRRPAPPADPPQRRHRRTGLPTLLQPAPGAAAARWCGWPGSAGASKNPSKPRKASPASTSTRSAAGPPGTAGPPSPCSPTPSSPSPPPSNATTHRHPAGLIELTVNEFRRLFDALLLAAKHTIDTLLAWSRWRRRHQARARECHYRRGETQ